MSQYVRWRLHFIHPQFHSELADLHYFLSQLHYMPALLQNLVLSRYGSVKTYGSQKSIGDEAHVLKPSHYQGNFHLALCPQSARGIKAYRHRSKITTLLGSRDVYLCSRNK